MAIGTGDGWGLTVRTPEAGSTVEGACPAFAPETRTLDLTNCSRESCQRLGSCALPDDVARHLEEVRRPENVVEAAPSRDELVALVR